MAISRYTDSLSTVDCAKMISSIHELLVTRLPESEQDNGKSTSPFISYTLQDLDTCRVLRQIEALYKKREDTIVDFDILKKKGIEDFMETERLCSIVNERYFSDGFLSNDEEHAAVIRRAREIVFHLVGTVPPIDELKCRFSSGAVVGVKKKEAHVSNKLDKGLSCTRNSVMLLRRILPFYPHFTGSISISRAALCCVPKTFDKVRTITVEPQMNNFICNGIGDYLRKRIKGLGINLYSQEKNQRKARAGSISGELATVDLSNASDLVSYSLVHALLPDDWFELLEESRSCEFTLGDGTVHEFEKFSGQGNGFTFPLESIIFYSLAVATCVHLKMKPDVTVYGDDIVINSGAAALLYSLFGAIGLKINESKSFHSGPFRESCGADYYSGIDIRPYYFKNPSFGPELFVAHNHFVRLCDTDISSIILENIRDDVRIYGPDGMGDGHLLGGPELKPHGRSKGWAGFIFETYQLRGDFLPLDKLSRVLPCYSIYVFETEDPASRGKLLSPTRTGQREVPISPEPSQIKYLRGNAEERVLVPVFTPKTTGQRYKKISIYTLNNV